MDIIALNRISIIGEDKRIASVYNIKLKMKI